MNTIEALLENHFQYNCVPAIPNAYVKPAVEALNWVKQGEFDVIVYLPKDLKVVPNSAKQHNGVWYVTSSDLVDALHIHAPEFYQLLESK